MQETKGLPLDPQLPQAQPDQKPKTLHIYQAMVEVAGELAKVGVSKDRTNEQQHFRFRGIDDVMNAVGPILARHNVLLVPSYTGEPDEDRVAGKNQTSLIFSKLVGQFTFISALDGSFVTVQSLGKAMDSGDKGTNKAMSAALKYALLHTFLIPTESSEDADATTQEASVPKPPAGFEDWFTELISVAATGFDPIRDAWNKSPAKYRDYAMQYRKAQWDAAKKQATTVTTKAAKPTETPAS